MSNPQQYQAIIVGAGLSGLSTARALTNKGLSVSVLESEQQVATPWRNRHPQLRLNIHEHFIHLPGRKLRHQDGTFVRRENVVRYLEEYASDLEPVIQKGVRVQQINKISSGWELVTSSGKMACKHLIIATGRERIPYLPQWPGLQQFSGKVIHAANLGDIRQYDGKKVLVIGAGNSGADVLNHLSKHHSAKVWVSVRHGTAILPTRLLGYPIHRTAKLFNLMPEAMLNAAMRFIQRLAYGDLTRFGLMAHPVAAGTRMLRDGVTPALDDGFVNAIKQGRFEVVPETISFEQHEVQLRGGKVVDPDFVICATGYRSDLEYLLGQYDVLDPKGHPLHPMGEPDPNNPGLWFTGFRPIFTGFFHAAGIAARRIALGVIEQENCHHTAPVYEQEKAVTDG